MNEISTHHLQQLPQITICCYKITIKKQDLSSIFSYQEVMTSGRIPAVKRMTIATITIISMIQL